MITRNLSPSVKQCVFKNGRVITLVGTAHVSKESVHDVEQTIDAVKPDRICLELDAGRYKSKTQKDDWEKTDIRKVFKKGKGFLMIANTALAGYQKRMGDTTGSAPGSEILAAGHIAEERNIPYSLCDREIQITLKRAWRLSRFWDKMKLLGELFSAAFGKGDDISPEEFEELKKADTMQAMLKEMARELPAVKSVLIDERDKYLATSIWQSEGKNIVAVIGAGHRSGILKQFVKLEKGEPAPDLEKLCEVPPASKGWKAVAYAIPAAIIAIIVMGFVRSGWQQGARMFGYWVLVNAVFTAIGAIASLAHPLTLILSALAAPFTSLNPTIGVGIVAAILQLTFRKPKVRDFENLAEDASHFRSWYSNRILQTFLVFLFTSVGSSIGTFVGFPVLLKLMGGN